MRTKSHARRELLSAVHGIKAGNQVETSIVTDKTRNLKMYFLPSASDAYDVCTANCSHFNAVRGAKMDIRTICIASILRRRLNSPIRECETRCGDLIWNIAAVHDKLW